MSDWTINIETAPGRVTEDQAEQLLEQLLAGGTAIAPATSWARDVSAGAAVYQITADDYPAAISLGVRVFLDAQRAIGLEPTMRNMTVDIYGDPRAA